MNRLALLGLTTLLVAACGGCSSAFVKSLGEDLRSPFERDPTDGVVPSTPDLSWGALSTDPSHARLPGALHDAATTNVRINGKVADSATLARIGAAPGQIPAGDYWYDARSGLWGLAGDGARGQITSGLALGELDERVSRGDTGVLINGREITRTELALVQSVVGPVAPGRYFLDADGSAGPEGGRAVVNLFRRPGGGSGGGQATYFGHSGHDGTGGGFYDPSTGDSYYSFTDSSGKRYSTN